LALTDRQWKGTTSWILGVAFARFVMEKENYPFWLPVSACTPSKAAFRTSTGKWTADRPREWHTVRRRSNAGSRYLPDYLVCRLAASGTYEYGFVESKGTDRNVRALNSALPKWIDQVNSADLEYQMKQMSVARRLIVATRINPKAKTDEGRAIVVRAWNRDDHEQSDDPIRFALFLAEHYAGLCRRLGLYDHAEAMVQAGNRIAPPPEESQPGGAHRRSERAERALKSKLLALSYEPNNWIDLGNVEGRPVRHGTERHVHFLLGDRVFEAALTTAALDIMQALDSGDVNRVAGTAYDTLRQTREWMDYYRDRGNDRIAITLNGVAVFDAEALTRR
jgi:hypothetical protein